MNVIVPIFSVGGFNYVKVSRVRVMSTEDEFPPLPYNP